VNRDKLCTIAPDSGDKGDLAKVIKVSGAARRRLHEDRAMWSFSFQMARHPGASTRIAITS
jgi:hypothetical protein